MKLLDRKAVSTQKANEELVGIKEGIKLAKKIDVLRETASKEESNLAKFRIETLKNVQEEIDSLIRQKSGLAAEVKELTDRKEDLKKRIESITKI